MTEPTVTIYTDGGADPNPGYGGWGAILRYGGHEKELKGHAFDTTNNRMELQAAIEALSVLKRPCTIDFYTDSQYLRRGISEWIEGWAAQNWQSKNKVIQNVDLWQKLWPLTKKHTINWHWVKGHAGNEFNERVDELATQARLAITPQETVDQTVTRLYVRGSCKGNPGRGGWGAVIEDDGFTEQFSGNELDTTNNRMELVAVIEGLKQLDHGTAVQIITVSDYLYQGATQWINGWRKRNWQKKEGQPIANADLWQRIDQAGQQLHIQWFNAKGKQDDYLGLQEASQLAATAVQELAT